MENLNPDPGLIGMVGGFLNCIPFYGEELCNEWKEKLGVLFESRCAELSGSCSDEEPYPGDPTLPGRRNWEGGLHILHRVIKDIKQIFYRMGYSIAEGPDVELDYYNFEALNFPADHPSRDLQDTFYVNRDILLRTQTSPVQVRFMEKNEPPLRIISPGRVYRNETPDPSHAAEFFQIEGLTHLIEISNFKVRAMLDCPGLRF